MAEREADALLIDFGGVLTTPILEAFAAFLAETGIDPGVLPRLIREAYHGEDGDHFIRDMETGRITEEEFSRRLAHALSEGLHTPISPHGLKERLFAAAELDQKMIAAVRAVHAAGLKTGLISNTWGPTGFPEELRDLFDETVMSGEVGIRKPDPGIYLMAAERLGVAPERCAFVDDIQANTKGAEAVGMKAVLHRTADTTIPKLEALLGVTISQSTQMLDAVDEAPN